MSELKQRLLASIIMSGLLMLPGTIFADQAIIQKNQILVTGVVPDRRIIVVNPDLTITKMYSNTAKNVIPTVMMGSISGSKIPLNSAIKHEYVAIMSQLKTNKVVTVSSLAGSLPNEYPNFVTPGRVSSFMVKPTVMPGDSAAASYTVSIDN